MFCPTCGYNFEVTASSQMSPASNKFCRRCGSRLHYIGEKPPDEKAILTAAQDIAANASRRHGEPQIFLITAMWALTIASWVCIFALEPIAGIVLDLAAVLVALILIFLPPAVNRINGGVKMAIEAAAFALSVWHR